MGLKNEFETAVVNEPSVFEPLKIYCIRNFSTFRNTNLRLPRLGLIGIKSKICIANAVSDACTFKPGLVFCAGLSLNYNFHVLSRIAFKLAKLSNP